MVLALLRGRVSRRLNSSVHLSPARRWPAAGGRAGSNGTRACLCPRRHTTVIITPVAGSLSRAPHKGCVRATMGRVPGINRRRRRVSRPADQAEMTRTQPRARPTD